MAETNNQPQQEAQQPETQAQQVQQPVQVEQKQHPLSGVQFGAMMPYANYFAASMQTFLSCFEDRSYGERAFRKEVEYSLQAFANNSFLVTCARQNPQDLITSIQNVALSGLSLSPTLKQGYLVPFKNRITFMVSYMGMRDLLIKTGLCMNIEAHLVYKDDYFSISYGEGGRLEHRPNAFSKNRTKDDIMGGYFIATLPSGQLIYDTMSIMEIEEVRKASPSYGKSNSPWDGAWYPEMCKKTLIRRGFKSIPHTDMNEKNLQVIEATMKNDDQFFYEEKKNNTPKRSDFDEDVQIVD